MIDDSELFRIRFWSKLENKLGTIVPIHVKNICKYNSLDNPLSFRNLNDKVLEEIEKFVQTELLDLIADQDENLQNYFGFYHKKPEKFKFTIGEKFLLLEMAEFVRSKSKEFFAMNTTNNLTTTESVQKKAAFPINIEENMQNKCEESILKKESTYMSDESDFYDNTTDTFPSSPAGTRTSWEGTTENATSTTGNDDVKKLTRQIRTMVKSTPAGYLPDVSRRLKNLQINIEKIENENSTYLEATIACPICNFNVNCIRSVGVEGSRWKMNNFSKHIKTHTYTDDKNFDIKNEPWL